MTDNQDDVSALITPVEVDVWNIVFEGGVSYPLTLRPDMVMTALDDGTGFEVGVTKGASVVIKTGKILYIEKVKHTLTPQQVSPTLTKTLDYINGLELAPPLKHPNDDGTGSY